MRRKVINDLIEAREFSRAGKYAESIEIFDKHYSRDPESLRQAHRDEYALALYHAFVKGFSNADESLKAAEFITELSSQKDTTDDSYCIYTITVFSVLRHLNSNKEYSLFHHWLAKIDPELLGDRRHRKNGRVYSSNTESYYEYLSMAHFYNREYEECIEVSKKAFDVVKTFTNDGDTWIRWRMGKSLKELNRFDEALYYLEKVIEVMHEEYMYRMIAEIHYILNDSFKALDYLCPVVLSDDSPRNKLNTYYMIYTIMKNFNPEMALPHAQIYCLLKRESGSYVESEIQNLMIDETSLNKRDLLDWIKSMWIQYKFRYQELQHGEIIEFKDDEEYGFIKSEADVQVFFKKDQFEDDTLFIGQMVSFYTEESLDIGKNEKSLKAVYVRGE